MNGIVMYFQLTQSVLCLVTHTSVPLTTRLTHFTGNVTTFLLKFGTIMKQSGKSFSGTIDTVTRWNPVRRNFSLLLENVFLSSAKEWEICLRWKWTAWKYWDFHSKKKAFVWLYWYVENVHLLNATDTCRITMESFTVLSLQISTTIRVNMVYFIMFLLYLCSFSLLIHPRKLYLDQW